MLFARVKRFLVFFNHSMSSGRCLLASSMCFGVCARQFYSGVRNLQWFYFGSHCSLHENELFTFSICVLFWVKIGIKIASFDSGWCCDAVQVWVLKNILALTRKLGNLLPGVIEYTRRLHGLQGWKNYNLNTLRLKMENVPKKRIRRKMVNGVLEGEEHVNSSMDVESTGEDCQWVLLNKSIYQLIKLETLSQFPGASDIDVSKTLQPKNVYGYSNGSVN